MQRKVVSHLLLLMKRWEKFKMCHVLIITLFKLHILFIGKEQSLPFSLTSFNFILTYFHWIEKIQWYSRKIFLNGLSPAPMLWDKSGFLCNKRSVFFSKNSSQSWKLSLWLARNTLAASQFCLQAFTKTGMPPAKCTNRNAGRHLSSLHKSILRIYKHTQLPHRNKKVEMLIMGALEREILAQLRRERGARLWVWRVIKIQFNATAVCYGQDSVAPSISRRSPPYLIFLASLLRNLSERRVKNAWIPFAVVFACCLRLFFLSLSRAALPLAACFWIPSKGFIARYTAPGAIKISSHLPLSAYLWCWAIFLHILVPPLPTPKSEIMSAMGTSWKVVINLLTSLEQE